MPLVAASFSLGLERVSLACTVSTDHRLVVTQADWHETRGGPDCLMAGVDGLTGLPEAMATVFPKTQVPLGSVPNVRNSLK
jgi:hypothetical protein